MRIVLATLVLVSVTAGGCRDRDEQAVEVTEQNQSLPPTADTEMVSLVAIRTEVKRQEVTKAFAAGDPGIFEAVVLGLCEPGCPGGEPWTEDARRKWEPQIDELPARASGSFVRLVVLMSPTPEGARKLSSGQCLAVTSVRLLLDGEDTGNLQFDGSKPVLFMKPPGRPEVDCSAS